MYSEDEPRKDQMSHVSIESEIVSEVTKAEYNQFFDTQRQYVIDARAKKTDDPGRYALALDASALHHDGGRYIKEILESHGQLNGIAHIAKTNESRIVGFEVETFDTTGAFVGGYIGVDLENRGKGIGSELIKQRHEEFRRRGINRYTIEMTKEAVQAFIRSGATVTEIQKNELGESTYEVIL